MGKGKSSCGLDKSAEEIRKKVEEGKEEGRFNQIMLYTYMWLSSNKFKIFFLKTFQTY